MDDNQTNDPTVNPSSDAQEAQVVEGELIAPEGAEELMSLTNLIKTHINKIELMGQTLAKATEMLNDMLDNDEEYRTQVDVVKKATKDKNVAKQRVLNIPQARDISEKVKEGKNNLKELKDNLSDYLTEYARLTGSTEFEDDAGQLHKIVYVARLIKQ